MILRIANEDAAAEEFDSPALQVEKAIVAGHSPIVLLRPLAQARYELMAEDHPETAKGP